LGAIWNLALIEESKAGILKIS